MEDAVGGWASVNCRVWFAPMGSKRKVSLDEQLEAAVASARAGLEAKGVATGALLGAAAVRPQVVARLCSEGYEPTATGLRVALEGQAEKLLAQGKPMSLSGLAKRLKGAKAAEVKELAMQLNRDGKAHIVLRGKVSYLVSCGETVLRRDELEAAVKGLKAAAAKLRAIATWMEKARKDKLALTVLESDLHVELAALSALLEQSSAKTKVAVPDLASTKRADAQVVSSRRSVVTQPDLGVALRGAILALRDEDSRLASIPQVSRRLRELATAEAVAEALLAEYGQGRLELRPEGGIGRLSEEERALCPIGAGGIPLSWVSLLEE